MIQSTSARTELVSEGKGAKPSPMTLKAPFPYAGGKSWVSHVVWVRLGPVANYIEPLCGSAAMLLGRPYPPRTETINDIDGFICNAYRAIRADAESVAQWCDVPVSECDLHARHAWLIMQREGLTSRLEGDPDYYDAKVAGWWIWGACCWIGSGWCSRQGPWQVVDGQLVHLGNARQGIHRKLPHLGDAGREDDLLTYLLALADRIRHVRITCGPWDRILGPSVTWKHGLTGIFLDPPYRDDEHSFGYVAGGHVWEACWTWAVQHGDHPLLRIALCGYDDGRPVHPGWTAMKWKNRGGYGSQGHGRGRDNAAREIVYFSPNCRAEDQDLPLFRGNLSD